VVRSVRAAFPDLDVVVIDDASPDSSACEARSAGALVLRHGCNLGYGAALETGYMHALASGYDFAVQMDGDGQHLPDQVRLIMAPVLNGSADIVIGSRYRPDGATATTPLRRAGHALFASVLRLTTGLRLSDPTSGFQAITRRALHLFTSGAFPCDYPDSDVILMCRLAGLRIVEVPVRMADRSGGQSMHAGLRPLYYSAKVTLSMFIVALNFLVWRAWRRERTANEAGEKGGSTPCL